MSSVTCIAFVSVKTLNAPIKRTSPHSIVYGVHGLSVLTVISSTAKGSLFHHYLHTHLKGTSAVGAS